MDASHIDPESQTDPDALEILQVLVNGEPQTLPSPGRVCDLLEVLGMTGRRVAVAVNRHVVARSAYAETALSDGDRIEILEAVGGG